LQDRASNHRKLLQPNGWGGERFGKRRGLPVRCESRRRTIEPLIMCRKRRDVIETRLLLLARDEARGAPVYCPSGDRHQGGASSATGSCAERGNLSPRCKGKSPSGRPARRKVPMRGEGADWLVVAMKPGNAGGAKGPTYSALAAGQPERGGACG